MKSPLEHGIGTTSYNVYPNLHVCLPSGDGWRVVFHGMIQSEQYKTEDEAQDRLVFLLRQELRTDEAATPRIQQIAERIADRFVRVEQRYAQKNAK